MRMFHLYTECCKIKIYSEWGCLYFPVMFNFSDVLFCGKEESLLGSPFCFLRPEEAQLAAKVALQGEAQALGTRAPSMKFL